MLLEQWEKDQNLNRKHGFYNSINERLAFTESLASERSSYIKFAALVPWFQKKKP